MVLFRRKKRKVQETDIKNRTQLLYIIDKLETYNPLRDKALVSFLYLTGARVSEIVKRVRKYDLEKEVLEDQEFLVVYNVQCLKRRKGNEAKRNIPIHIEKEKEFLKYLYAYMNTLQDDDILFPVSRQHAFNIMRKIGQDYWPHLMRHYRNSHLASLYGFNSSDLRSFNGWTNDAPSATYVHLNWRHLARKF